MAKTGFEEKSLVDYDKEVDVLSLSRNRKVKDSLELGDVIVDFDTKLFVSGVEILNASKNLNVPKSILSNIKKASMMIIQRQSSITILIRFLGIGVAKEATTLIPLNPHIGRGQVFSTSWMDFMPTRALAAA